MFKTAKDTHGSFRIKEKILTKCCRNGCKSEISLSVPLAIPAGVVLPSQILVLTKFCISLMFRFIGSVLPLFKVNKSLRGTKKKENNCLWMTMKVLNLH